MRRRPRRFLFFIPVIIGGVFLFTWITQLLWNGLLPDILGVKAITYFQAMGILVLSKILFGFGGGGGRRRGRWRGEMGKWNNMTPEDRTKWKEEWRDRCRNAGFFKDKTEQQYKGDAGAE